jgi:hypothetical protein
MLILATYLYRITQNYAYGYRYFGKPTENMGGKIDSRSISRHWGITTYKREKRIIKTKGSRKNVPVLPFYVYNS